MAKEAFEALRSSCELKTDFDKLQAIENGSKEDLRLLPITLSLITINFCCVLTRRKKKPPQLLYWRRKYNLYSYISFVMLNAEDVQNTGELWLLHLLMNRILYTNCSQKG